MSRAISIEELHQVRLDAYQTMFDNINEQLKECASDGRVPQAVWYIEDDCSDVEQTIKLEYSKQGYIVRSELSADRQEKIILIQLMDDWVDRFEEGY